MTDIPGSRLYALEVGKPYISGRTRWPETPDLSIGPHGVELRLFYSAPTEQEVAAVRRGKARFGWIDGDHAALLCFMFTSPDGRSGVPWAEAPYHAGREPADRAGLPGESGTALVATILLIDAGTGILRAIRQVGWPVHAADAVRATLTRQRGQGLNEIAEATFLDNLFQRYPGKNGSKQLVNQRADVIWTGGEPTATPGTGPLASPPPAPAPAAPAGSPAAVLAEAFPGMIATGRTYHSPLPAELVPWYCYIADGGHSIAVVPATLVGPGGPDSDHLVPAPVKAVLAAGWQIRDGFVVCELPYDADLGLTTGPEYDEF